MADTFSSGDLTPESEDQSEVDEASDDKKILAEAHARLRLAEEAESEIRKLALEDLEFRSGKQWPDAIQAERERDGRPCLIINRIPQFIQQVTNDQRQNRPSIKVHPIDNEADIETAKVISGLIRHIEYNSNADVAYDTAFDSAVTGGFGYLRVITEYADPESFNQEILIKRVRNPFSVFFDPYSQEPDGSDANWAHIVDDLSPEEYKAKYPDSKMASMSDWDSIGNSSPGWVRDGGARVAEYFYKDFEEIDLVQLSDGQTLEKSQALTYMAEVHARAHAEAQVAAQNAGYPDHALPTQEEIEPPVSIVRERKSKKPIIKWCKLNAVEILEKTVWPGSYIPIVPVYGNELFINGKRILEGIVRNSKDPQRMYNYWASAETEAIALAPRTPFVGAEGQFEGFETEWKTANRRNHAYLQYKPVSLNGQPAPPPQRQVFEPAVQAITQARGLAADDLKATTGIYDSALGALKNDASGIAIQRRNMQSQTGNFHFVDNLTRSLKHVGRILIDLIPRIYDTAIATRIIGEDGEQKIVQLNAPTEDASGKPILYSLDVGKYDATIDIGPNFASKRQEAVASMLEVTKTNPKITEVAGDLIVKSMDWPGASEIAERLRKTLPPGLAEDPKQKGQPLPPQVQAQMQQMQQLIQQLTGHLNETTKVLETKKLDLEHRERIEIMKLQVDLEIEMAKMGSQESIALLKHEIQAINQRLQMLDINQPIDIPNFAPQASGGMPAQAGPPGAPPTGGQSPGQPMEGN